MNYFDTRTSRALMENRIEEATKVSQRARFRFTVGAAAKERVGAWMIKRGEQLIRSQPKMA